MPEIPDWIDSLVDRVARHLIAENQLGPLGIRFREEEDGSWEVVIHPTPVELVGGAEDGAVVSPSFTFDLEGLRGEFAKVNAVGVSSHGMYEDEDSYFWVAGRWDDRTLTLRVLLKPPEDEEPGSKLNVAQRDE